MFNKAFNNSSMLKLFFSINIHTFAMYCKNVSHQYYAIIHDSKPHILLKNCSKQGQIIVYLLLFATAYFIMQSFFPLKGKLKGIITYFPNKKINDIIQCYQVSHEILTLPPLMLTDMTQYCQINRTQPLKSTNPIHKMSTDLSRI